MGIVVVAALAAMLGGGPVSCNYTHRATGEIGRSLGEPLGHAIGMTIFKRNVLAFKITEIAQPLPENIPHRRIIDDADARNLPLLLRTRAERPRGGRTAKRGNEFSPPNLDCHVTPPVGSSHATEEGTTL
jgi:hypothetical protein